MFLELDFNCIGLQFKLCNNLLIMRVLQLKLLKILYQCCNQKRYADIKNNKLRNKHFLNNQYNIYYILLGSVIFLFHKVHFCVLLHTFVHYFLPIHKSLLRSNLRLRRRKCIQYAQEKRCVHIPLQMSGCLVVFY